jgi:hypothetical protein
MNYKYYTTKNLKSQGLGKNMLILGGNGEEYAKERKKAYMHVLHRR